jgi:hypothetical protein
MQFGRLIRVRAHRRDPEATIYVVAEAEVEKAIDILKIALAHPYDEYEDLGRVTDTLLIALGLQRQVRPHLTSLTLRPLIFTAWSLPERHWQPVGLGFRPSAALTWRRPGERRRAADVGQARLA